MHALSRERTIIALCLLAIVMLAWTYLLIGAGTGMSSLAMTTWQFPPPVPNLPIGGRWDWTYAALMLAMWSTMMIAMMLPGAAPFIMLYARVAAHARSTDGASSIVDHTAILASGYLVVWLAFSALATTVQWLLERIGLLHDLLMWSTSAGLSATLLIAAGVYQLTPAKTVCLEHCRSPIVYLASSWRPGRSGAFLMGATHGTYCVGCCWLLMGLLFVGGAMNLVWIAGLSLVVLVEKLWSGGVWFGKLVGSLLLLAGVGLMAAFGL